MEAVNSDFSGRIMTMFILYRRYHLIIGHAEKEVVNINTMEYLGCCWALFLPSLSSS